ncbi:hypothetical protein ACROYT_G015442 [Oculina patagonica]
MEGKRNKEEGTEGDVVKKGIVKSDKVTRRNVMDGNGLILMEEKCKRMLEEDVKVVDEEESGSNCDPGKDSQKSSDSDEDEEGESPGAKPPHGVHQASSKKGKSPVPFHYKNNAPEEGSEDSSEEQVAAAVAAAQRPCNSTKSSKRSHHKKNAQ